MGNESTTSVIESPRLNQLLDALPNSVGRSGKERRSHARFKIDRPVMSTLFRAAGKPTMELHLCDVSVTGAGLLGKRPFQVNEAFVIALYVAGEGSKLVLCEVRSCAYSAKGMYRLGVEFMASHPDPEKAGKIPMLWLRRYSGS